MDNIKVFVKTSYGYEKCTLIIPERADWKFYKSLKLTLEYELNNIRDDILSLYKNPEDVNLAFLKHDDYEIQEKLSVLSEIRKNNSDVRDFIVKILHSPDFIVCHHCSKKMYKTPLGVSCHIINGKLIPKNTNESGIRYVYLCENCIFAESEEMHAYKIRMRELRDRLLSEGESFVPNEQGFWAWANDNKTTKPREFFPEDRECDHVWERTFEEIDIKNSQQKFIKIQEICKRCSKKVTIK